MLGKQGQSSQDCHRFSLFIDRSMKKCIDFVLILNTTPENSIKTVLGNTPQTLQPLSTQYLWYGQEAAG